MFIENNVIVGTTCTSYTDHKIEEKKMLTGMTVETEPEELCSELSSTRAICNDSPESAINQCKDLLSGSPLSGKNVECPDAQHNEISREIYHLIKLGFSCSGPSLSRLIITREISENFIKF